MAYAANYHTTYRCNVTLVIDNDRPLAGERTEP